MTTDESLAHAEDHIAAILALGPEIIEALEDAVRGKDNEWWSCNGGKVSHDQIRAEQAEIQRVLDKARELLG